ncbi:SPD-2 protein [Aphelenchoides avenae]|nr:SPD-2 protein [Aphelenchus avenae]
MGRALEHIKCLLGSHRSELRSIVTDADKRALSTIPEESIHRAPSSDSFLDNPGPSSRPHTGAGSEDATLRAATNDRYRSAYHNRSQQRSANNNEDGGAQSVFNSTANSIKFGTKDENVSFKRGPAANELVARGEEEFDKDNLFRHFNDSELCRKDRSWEPSLYNLQVSPVNGTPLERFGDEPDNVSVRSECTDHSNVASREHAHSVAPSEHAESEPSRKRALSTRNLQDSIVDYQSSTQSATRNDVLPSMGDFDETVATNKDSGPMFSTPVTNRESDLTKDFCNMSAINGNGGTPRKPKQPSEPRGHMNQSIRSTGTISTGFVNRLAEAAPDDIVNMQRYLKEELEKKSRESALKSGAFYPSSTASSTQPSKLDLAMAKLSCNKMLNPSRKTQRAADSSQVPSEYPLTPRSARPTVEWNQQLPPLPPRRAPPSVEGNLQPPLAKQQDKQLLYLQPPPAKHPNEQTSYLRHESTFSRATLATSTGPSTALSSFASVRSDREQQRVDALPQLSQPTSSASTVNTAITDAASTTSRRDSGLAVNTDYLFFGFVPAGQSNVKQLRLTNRSCETMQIYIKDVSTNSIPPGGHSVVRVEFKPWDKSGFVNKLVIERTNSTKRTYKVPLCGMGGRAALEPTATTMKLSQSGIYVLTPAYMNAFTLGLQNAGVRDAFAYVTLVDANHEPVPGVEISPSRVIVRKQLQETKAITVSIGENMDSHRRLSITSARSTVTVVSTADRCAFRVLIYWGEERHRQRLKKLFGCADIKREALQQAARVFDNGPKVTSFTDERFEGETAFDGKDKVNFCDFEEFLDAMRQTIVNVVDSRARSTSICSARSQSRAADHTLDPDATLTDNTMQCGNQTITQNDTVLSSRR